MKWPLWPPPPSNMQYIFTLWEGFTAFFSPCILPMLPVYLLYLAADSSPRKRTVHTLCFVGGFALSFMAMGATAAAAGGLIMQNKPLLTRIAGFVIILFGLQYAGLLPFSRLFHAKKAKLFAFQSYFGAFVFGLAYSFGWTPCLGPLLGAVLMLAATLQTMWQGILLLLCFSIGLGIPFLLTSALYERCENMLSFLKRHSEKIAFWCGILLCMVGISLLLNIFPYYLSIF